VETNKTGDEEGVSQPYRRKSRETGEISPHENDKSHDEELTALFVVENESETRGGGIPPHHVKMNKTCDEEGQKR